MYICIYAGADVAQGGGGYGQDSKAHLALKAEKICI